MRAAASRKKQPPARHPYSKAWREQYSRSLTREEIRLVQAYRGLVLDVQQLLLKLASRLIIRRAQGQ